MKNFTYILSLLILPYISLAQETIELSIIHDDLQRDYILYIPGIYDGEDAVPLILNFHGYGSNATEQLFYGDFRSIADTANFLVVHPEGTLLNNVSHWNVGGWTFGSTVDDVAFTSALIDSLSIEYNIDPERIYATGMSNGGFMSYLLACQLSERIAAIASVTGSMTPQTYENCDPQRPMPIMHIHGTDDSVVPYLGAFFTEPVETALAYWVTFNNAEQEPSLNPIVDSNTSDGSNVEHIVYEGGDAGVSIEHFKVYGGDHTWPGTFFNQPGTNYDIDASLEIWKFLSSYNINGLIGNSSSLNEELDLRDLSIYPNPAKNNIRVLKDHNSPQLFEIYNSSGIIVKQGVIEIQQENMDISDLPTNMYFLRIGKEITRFMKY